MQARLCVDKIYKPQTACRGIGARAEGTNREGKPLVALSGAAGRSMFVGGGEGRRRERGALSEGSSFGTKSQTIPSPLNPCEGTPTSLIWY
jgi:hypothetical protein